MPYLLTSLYTLRQYWRGQVAVFAWDESYEIVKLIARDERLRIVPCRREPQWRGKNSQFVDKILLMQEQIDAHSALYLDADTLIAGSLHPLFDLAEMKGFVGTQFCNWRTDGGIISGRIRRLREFPQIDQNLIELVLANPYPSPNGGIFACVPHSPVLSQWHDWTMIACEKPPIAHERWKKGVFIADETVLQIMPVKMPEHISVAEGGAYNCSPKPKYRPGNLPDEHVRVWHGHGNCFSRPEDKSPEGYQMWRQVWDHCVEQDLGCVKQWAHECQAQHKFFKRMEPLCPAGI
jgi:hypothetical protein